MANHRLINATFAWPPGDSGLPPRRNDAPDRQKAELQPIGGFCAETAGAITLIGAATAGIPVSTTHTITGAISGVGAAHRLSAVRWGVAGRIVWAWLLTIPASAGIAGLTYVVLRALT